MNKKQKTLIAVLAILAITMVGLSIGVVAKYIASINKSATATVAKWAFEGDNNSTVLNCDPISYDTDTLSDGKIAPGTTGTCEIELSNENSEVGVDYTITASITNSPANLIFKHNGSAFSNGGTITGTLTPGETGVPITIDWEWPYETTNGDSADTTAGEAGATMSISFKIDGVQVRPVAN